MLRKPYWVTAGFLVAAVLVFLLARLIAANRHLDAAMASSAAADFPLPNAPQKPTAPVRISAAQLYSEYDQNAVAANDEFAGRTLEVSGKILSAEKQSDDAVRVRIGVDQYGFNDIEARIAKSSNETVAKLKKGHSVTLVCKKVHRELGSVTLDRCAVAPVD
jgi:hypothetical protein